MSDRSSDAVHPTGILLAWALVGFGMGRFLPVQFVPATLERPLVVATMLPGVAICIWAMLEFRRHRTSLDHTQPTTALVTSGPFRFSRNPVYIGLGLMMFGFAIDYGSLWSLLLLPPALLAIRQLTVLPEERYLEEKFGEPYRRYKSSVRRWL